MYHVSRKNVTCKSFGFSKFKLVYFSKQDVGTTFKWGHSACQSSKLTLALDCENLG